MITSVHSQTFVVQVKPVGSELWGYADIDGKLIIEPKYKLCYPFSEAGVAFTYKSRGNVYTFINLKGEEIKVEIDDFILKDAFGFGAQGFHDGLVAVRKSRKWGYLNSEGKVAIPIKFKNTTIYDGGHAIVFLGKDMFFIMDKYGKVIPVKIPGLKDIKHFSENLASFNQKQQIGFIDTASNIVIQPQFYAVGYFHSGFAWAKTRRFGYINHKGDWIIKPQFTAAKDFDSESGLARVRVEKTWAYADTVGNIKYFKISEIPFDFSEGLARGKKDGKIGFFNNKEEWVIQPQFEGARDFKNGYAAVKLGGKWGIIDKKGTWVIQPIFLGIRDVSIVRN